MRTQTQIKSMRESADTDKEYERERTQTLQTQIKSMRESTDTDKEYERERVQTQIKSMREREHRLR